MKIVTYISNSGRKVKAEFYCYVSVPVESVVVINKLGAPLRVESDKVIMIKEAT